MEVRHLLAQTHKLPNIPEVVQKLIQQLADPDADYSDIAENVSGDQTLSLSVLRMVNSAQFGIQRQVSSIDEAVVMLGLKRLRTLTISSGISGSVSKVPGIDVPKFWADAFVVATISRWYAERTDGADTEVAYTAGLIHNIGQLLLHLTIPSKAMAIDKRVKETGCSRSALESKVLGFTTQEVGQALIDHWSFPEELGLAVRYYRSPGKAEESSPLAAVIHLAYLTNKAINEKATLEAFKEKFPIKVAKLAGIKQITDEDLEEVLKTKLGSPG